ncbi:response regulator [Anoxynatronum buryatiense]|uniref:Stage 0 sporulation protein A homolog n=1 Tax=Anoxynatronum buryatiense TaxID=489973 RepID=A0AA45WWW8_9CLOT|nr:response regulator [Anoxynatronum buryatiense]SMP61430.1 CheY chemotaxis protein or a CheY-like REC (receiver) domain [Anoxynatronum buryatiense]
MTFQKSASLPGGGVNRPRILFVEDNDISRELIRRIFRRMEELTVDVAKDGMEALALHQQYFYQLIFMDLQMPSMNGIEVTREIRRREKADGLNHTPVIAVTAYVGEEDRQRCLEAGMNDFLTKPVDTEALVKKIISHTRNLPEDETSEPVERHHE